MSAEAGEPGEAREAGDAPDRDRWDAARREAGFLAEVAALCGFVFARPVLGSFGASPETFIARGADAREVLIFGLLVTLAPLLGLAVPAAVAGFVLPSLRFTVHLVVVAVLGSLAAVQILRMSTDLSTVWVTVLGVLLAAGLVLLRWRAAAPLSTFLRYAGAASLIFLLQFVAFSPAGSLVRGGRSASVDSEVTAAVEDAVGGDAPPVVMVVLDALPTASLLDGEGNIDEELYPGLASLAGDGTWYRNHTTVAPETIAAVPSILSGRIPDGLGTPPVASAYSQNLFTLLGGVYALNVEEQVTALCPRSLCPAGGGPVGPMLADARNLWEESLQRSQTRAGLPGAFGHRYQGMAEWVDGQDFTPSGDPDLFFYHAILPHEPWNWLPGGQRYAGSMPATGSWLGRWGETGTAVGAQRHVLQTQAVDEVLQRMFDRMREAGIYDDALVVVTADHGVAFTPGAPQRGVAGEQFDQIMWTPLIVKEPGQREGTVDDTNVQGIDVLPTVAESLGVDLAGDLGWEVDGVTVEEAASRDPADKGVLDWEWSDLEPPDGETMVPVDGEEGFDRVLGADRVEGRGPMAPWQRTEHGGLVGRDLADLARGEPGDTTVDLGDLSYLDALDRQAPLPLEISGKAWLPEDEAVAVAVNGTVAAVARPVPTQFGVTSLHALLWPEPFVDGRNEVTLHRIDGPPQDPVLHELPIGPLES